MCHISKNIQLDGLRGYFKTNFFYKDQILKALLTLVIKEILFNIYKIKFDDTLV